MIDFETLQQGVLQNCFNVVNEEVIKEIIEENPFVEAIKPKNDDDILENLCNIDYVTIDIARKLIDFGIKTAKEILEKQTLLTKIKNYKKIIESAKLWIEEDNNV